MIGFRDQGADLSDLPVLKSSKFEFGINLTMSFRVVLFIPTRVI
jgi:hypothetical protein